MLARGSGALLQGGFRVGGRRDVPGGVSVLDGGRKPGPAGEAYAVFGRGGVALGEGDFLAVQLVLRGAEAAARLECRDR